MIRVYIKVYDASGVYESDFREITDDCILSKIGTISTSFSSNNFETGSFKVSDFNLTVANRGGLYSGEGDVDSIFQFKRSDSIVRITWQQQQYDNYLGMGILGESVLNQTEYTVFEGLLNDETTTESVQ